MACGGHCSAMDTLPLRALAYLSFLGVIFSPCICDCGPRATLLTTIRTAVVTVGVNYMLAHAVWTAWRLDAALGQSESAVAEAGKFATVTAIWLDVMLFHLVASVLVPYALVAGIRVLMAKYCPCELIKQKFPQVAKVLPEVMKRLLPFLVLLAASYYIDEHVEMLLDVTTRPVIRAVLLLYRLSG